MSVSGLGLLPSVRSAAIGSVRSAPTAAGSTPAAPAPNIFDSLTAADRELIYQATGQYMEPGYDGTQHPTSGFAIEIAGRRAYGQLSPGQEVTVGFLKDLSRQYDQADIGGNPIAPFLDKALAYLGSRGAPHLDVKA